MNSYFFFICATAAKTILIKSYHTLFFSCIFSSKKFYQLSTAVKVIYPRTQCTNCQQFFHYQVMVTNVTSLLKTVKAVEDEHTRGTRALESTIEAIAQEIRGLNTSDAQNRNVTPEDLVRCTKSITISTAKAVAAGNSCKQDDIIVAANMGRKSISDMLSICKSAAYHCAETPELRDRTLQAGHDVAMNYRELLQAILQISQRPSDAKHMLPPISRKIAQSVTELVAVAELLKGHDWVDPDDPTVIAENELLGAAASIDAAAKKLASLRPRKSIQVKRKFISLLYMTS